MERMVKEILQFLKANHYHWATCESFTGGGFAYEITKVPGSSAVYLGGYITYSSFFKQAIGVSSRIIKKNGLVSKATALEMARVTTEKTQAQLVISFTGNAGPTVQDGRLGEAFVAFFYLEKQGVWEFYRPDLKRQQFQKYVIAETLKLILSQLLI